MAAVAEDADMCPICKSSRYLNPDMKFLMNSECYHKMCESCVDRIYSLGPAPCPYPGCGKILRKNRFKTQVFEDVGVEREVDVRARVLKAFNKQQHDFETLDAFNDYLEEVENIVFNLANGIDVEQTDAKLQAYQQANRSAILANSLRVKQEEEAFEENQQYEAERRKHQLQLARQIDEQEKLIKKEGEQELLRRLAQSDGGDAAKIQQSVNTMVLKKTSAKRRELEDQMAAPTLPAHRRYPRAVSGSASNAPATPFTPFNGDRQTDYLFTVEQEYDDPWLAQLKEDTQFIAGGVSLHEAYRQMLVQAFFGLGCDIEREKAKIPEPLEDQQMVNVQG